MDLSDNRLNGAFPSLVSRLRNLQYLRVEKNLFTSMPASIGNMTWTTRYFLFASLKVM
jgi:Leucine-rich repeat (LRR) protein